MFLKYRTHIIHDRFVRDSKTKQHFTGGWGWEKNDRLYPSRRKGIGTRRTYIHIHT